MNQVWNIFRKDVRHHWREIAASLALLIAFVWVEVLEWARAGQGAMAFGAGSFAYEFLSGLVVPLVPISWMFLIVRAVQGESMVGDRQFWVTRPYDWEKLLATKALFILTFINLPLLLLDIFLLARAGFHPAPYLLGLLWLQLFWVLAVFLPTAALATITAGIGQMFLALLFVALCAIGVAAISEAVPNSSAPAGGGFVSALLAMATVLAVVLLQYSRRKTAISRWLIAALAAAILLIEVATPYRTLVLREYPLAADLPLRVALMPSQAPAPEDVTQQNNQVFVHLPLSLSGLPKDSFVELKGAILTLTNSQGMRWDSGWSGYSMLLFPDQKTADLTFKLKKTEFDRMKSSPVKAQLLLAFKSFHDRHQKQFVIPSGEFAIPDLGLCSARPGYFRVLDCRAPLRRPESMLVSTETAASTCPLGEKETPADPGEIARQFLRSDGPAEMGISPVKTFQLYLSDSNSSVTERNPGICPGTPLTLSTPEEYSRNRMELQFDNLSLIDYQRGSGTSKLVFKH
jgi:hypothetical protein